MASKLFCLCALLSLFYYLLCAVKVSVRSSILYFWLLLSLFFGICGLFPRVFLYFALPFFLFWFLFFLFLFFALRKKKDTGEKPDRLLLLGVRCDDTTPREIFDGRVREACVLMKEDPNLACILCGGRVFGEERSEAELLLAAMQKEGIGRERFVLESESRSTRENFLFARALLGEGDGCVGIVTSEYHRFRCQRLARRILPQETIFFTTPAPRYFLPHLYLREFFTFSVETVIELRSRTNKNKRNK